MQKDYLEEEKGIWFMTNMLLCQNFETPEALGHNRKM